MEIELVAVDLDGTLLDSAKRISDPAAAVFRQARQERGVHVVLASARPPRTVMPYYRQLELDSPMINYNGALVCHPPSGRVLLHRPIPTKTAWRVVRLARQQYPEVLVSGEIMDRWYTDRFEEAYATETSRLLGPDLVAPIDRWLTEPVTKILLLGQERRISEIAGAIGSRLGRQVSLVQTEGYLLQVMHAAASKAQALRSVAAELGVDRRAVLAIGDNANDVGMLQWAGVAAAVGNASPEAKAAATFLTDPNDADGAARAVQKVVFEGYRPGG